MTVTLIYECYFHFFLFRETKKQIYFVWLNMIVIRIVLYLLAFVDCFIYSYSSAQKTNDSKMNADSAVTQQYFYL